MMVFAQAHILRTNEQASGQSDRTDEFISEWIEMRRDEMKWQWSGLQNANIILV